MLLEFSGEVIYWRGPSPYHFVRVPDDDGAEIRALASVLTYGWGVIPLTVRIGDTEWTTSLFPKDGTYLVPLKDMVRRAEALEVGQPVDVALELTV
ncbi:MAG: DUF1905 domain-containing protein [Nocardioides sp.]